MNQTLETFSSSFIEHQIGEELQQKEFGYFN